MSQLILKIYSFFTRLTLVVGSLAIWNETAESLKDLCKLSNIYVNNIVYFKEPYAFNENIIEIVETTYSKTRSKIYFTFSTNMLKVVSQSHVKAYKGNTKKAHIKRHLNKYLIEEHNHLFFSNRGI